MEPLKFLSDEDVKAMHEATMRIMEEIGIIWMHKPSLDILTTRDARSKTIEFYSRIGSGIYIFTTSAVRTNSQA